MAGLHFALFCLLAFLPKGSTQIRCYTVPSVARELNCFLSTPKFVSATIKECCLENPGFFFEDTTTDESCTACIVFGFLNAPEITLEEQGKAILLPIGFIKGENVQTLTDIDSRNTGRFSLTITGTAMEGSNADFTIAPQSFEIVGPDATTPAELTTFIRIDGVALEPPEDFILTAVGRNNAGRAILTTTMPGYFVDPTLRVVIEDVENAVLHFTETDYSNREDFLFIVPVVQLLSNIATDLTVQIVPLSIGEVMARNLTSALPTLEAFNPRAPNIATPDDDFSTTPVSITFPAGNAQTLVLDPGIGIKDDTINEAEQDFALLLELVDAVDPARVDLRSERFIILARIFDNDPINIGFKQERYTLFEADVIGDLTRIPIVKENEQESELTFEVIGTLQLGSGPTAAQPGEDFDANPPVQRQDFDTDENAIEYVFELFDDSIPEHTETFQIQLSLADDALTSVNLGASGGSLFATATIVIVDDDGGAQIRCYTAASVAGEMNCFLNTPTFEAVTIEECCLENPGFFFEDTTTDESCTACIVFGFFGDAEITCPEQGDAIIRMVGFIKGGNVQTLTDIDSRDTGRFGLTITGTAMEGSNADFTIAPQTFEIVGPDATTPAELTTFIRIDGVALEPPEDFILTVVGRNNAGRTILSTTMPGYFVDPTLRVVIEDVENAVLQFTETDYSSPENLLFIRPVVQLLTEIATDLTVQVVPISIGEAMDRNLTSLLSIEPFNPREPNIATRDDDFSTTPVLITFPAGNAQTIVLDPGIGIEDDSINEAQQEFAILLELVDAVDPARVDLRSERFVTVGRIFDNDPINIGFEQLRYTVFEGYAVGDLTQIPIVKENDQLSELTFEVIAIAKLGSGPMAARLDPPGQDFAATPRVQDQDFDPFEQEIVYMFELFDDSSPEPAETFQIQLSLTDEGMVSSRVSLGAAGGSLFATATIVIVDDDGSAQIRCYTVPSVAGELNCFLGTPNFESATIEECCLENPGFFFEDTTTDESCTACIVFGFLNAPEITLEEQGEAILLPIGFIKGGNVQTLTAIDRRNTARFGITSAGSAMQGPNADFTIQPTTFEIQGPDARTPFHLITIVRIDGVALEPSENFVLNLVGTNNAGRAILTPAMPGHFVDPILRVNIADIENATLRFTESDYFNREDLLFIAPVVQLLTLIATDLTVRIVPLNITEAFARPLPSDFSMIYPFNPYIATSVADFSTVPVEITFIAGGKTTIPLVPGIPIVDDTINEAEQDFAVFLEVVDALDPVRVDLQSGRFASLARIFDDDPLNIGFEQERYTVFEAFNATGELIPIPIIKENNQLSELTFQVTATLTLGSGPMAAQPGEDFFTNTPVQRQEFDADEQEIDYRFELLDDTPANPNVPEPIETFQIQLSLEDEGLTYINLGASGGSLFATATVVIIDDDDVIIGWEQNLTSVNESLSILELCVRVMNIDDDIAFYERFEVSLAANTIRGTAVDPGDYIALEANNDVFFDLIDDATRRTCIEIEIINDNLLEGIEFFSIEVVPDPNVVNFPSNVRLDPDATFVEILDDDFVRIGFNQTQYGPALEGTDNTVTVYVAVLEGALQRSVTVTFETTVLGSDTATADVDFDSLTRELTFDASTTVIAVEITINDDTIFELFLETFTASLTRDPDDTPTDVIVYPNVATVSIEDNEVVTIGYDPVLYTVAENVPTASEDVTIHLLAGDLSGLPSSAAIPVGVAAQIYTATAGSDFSFAARTLNFFGGNTVFTLPVAINDDSITEGPEVFFMLADTTDGRVLISPEQANVTITDDDIVPVGFEQILYTATEGEDPFVELCAVVIGNVQLERQAVVSFATRDNTATSIAPVDFGGAAVDFTFGPGVSRLCVEVTIEDDDILEDEEDFFGTLTTTDPDVILNPDEARVVITEDPMDSVTIGFDPDSYRVVENEGPVTVTVRLLEGTLETTVSVNLHTSGATATPGEDYVEIPPSQPAVLQFDPSNRVRMVDIGIIDNPPLEPIEVFFGELTTSFSTVELDPQRANISIIDNDGVPELDLSFTGNSPRLGVGTINAELFSNRPGIQISCFLHRTTFIQDCSNGTATFTNVPAGGYSLWVIATDRETGDTVEIRAGVFVPKSDEFCSVNAINRLVSVSGNSATIEFISTGNPIGFLCRVDRQTFIPCTSPFTTTGLDSGGHRLRVRPMGCGRPRDGHKSLSVSFNV